MNIHIATIIAFIITYNSIAFVSGQLLHQQQSAISDTKSPPKRLLSSVIPLPAPSTQSKAPKVVLKKVQKINRLSYINKNENLADFKNNQEPSEYTLNKREDNQQQPRQEPPHIKQMERRIGSTRVQNYYSSDSVPQASAIINNKKSFTVNEFEENSDYFSRRRARFLFKSRVGK